VSGSVDVRGALGPLEVNASVFAARIAHPVQVRDAATDLPRVELVNASGPTRSSGADVSLVFRRGPLAVIGSYAFVATSEPDPAGAGRRATPLTPRHTAGLVAVTEGERGRVGLEVYYTGRQSLEPNPYRASALPYVVVGLLAERRIGRASLFVNLENLTDVRQTKTNPLVRPIRAADGNWTVDAWGPLDGRVVNGGVRWAW
jgi:iron complex outermembrane receptor protein